MMKFATVFALLVAFGGNPAIAFTLCPVDHRQFGSVVLRSAVAEESSAAETTTDAASTASVSEDIPTNLPSECGMDYVPLATMLATGQLAEADQVFYPSRRLAST